MRMEKKKLYFFCRRKTFCQIRKCEHGVRNLDSEFVPTCDGSHDVAAERGPSVNSRDFSQAAGLLWDQ